MRTSQLKGRSRLATLLAQSDDAERDMEGLRHRFKRLDNDHAKPRVVSSHNLFQTPEWLAKRMASMLNTGERLLEPSAGLGRLVKAYRELFFGKVVAIDISPDCCQALVESFGSQMDRVIEANFLSYLPEHLGCFDAILMNPPFHMREDIAHVLHAVKFLKPGGKLVGLCMAGSKREEAIKPLCDHWELLEPGIFEGTQTQAVLFSIQGKV